MQGKQFIALNPFDPQHYLVKGNRKDKNHYFDCLEGQYPRIPEDVKEKMYEELPWTEKPEVRILNRED